jgi:hypothetical protein
MTAKSLAPERFWIATNRTPDAGCVGYRTRQVRRNVRSGGIGCKVVIVIDVGDADHEYAHPAACPVNDSWRDVDQRTLPDAIFLWGLPNEILR